LSGYYYAMPPEGRFENVSGYPVDIILFQKASRLIYLEFVSLAGEDQSKMPRADEIDVVLIMKRYREGQRDIADN
jgi:hypothetical protein